MPVREVNLTIDSWEDDIYFLKDYIFTQSKTNHTQCDYLDVGI